jgi:glycosyltransferase involved in cell wall biosynthesis
MVDMTGAVCRALGIPYISICHGIPLSAERPNILLKWAYRLYERFLGLPVIAGASNVIAVSMRVQTILEQKGISSSRIRVAYPVLRIERQPSIRDFRVKFAIPTSSKIILCLGGLAYRKGQDLALQVANELVKKRNDFVLCLIGNDEGLRRQLQKTVQESGLSKHVAILGRLDPQLKESALQECSLVLVPSRDEPFGLVPLEAIAHNKPVLISYNAGIVELVKAPDLTFDPLDSESAAKKVDLILDDPSLGRSFVELARRSVVGDYWARTISVYEDLSLGTNA